MARPALLSGNLPAEVASFIGRRHELAEVRKRLADRRLVSLVGPGGVGKTRLALRIATELGRSFRGGAWLVELAEISNPAMVASAVMAALDLRDQAEADPLSLLLSYLRDSELLLVVDNCEHLLGAAAQIVTDVLKAAPGVRVITTSREPLSVAGEHVVPVPPLELPAPDATGPLALVRQNEAVMLFAERAAAAAGAFELTAANSEAVVGLCRRLDGLPLAIELAAVRTRVLTAEQILDRLTDRFSLLAAGNRAAQPRHQTLRTTIEWSHDLLSEGERAVLRRSCAFAGRFTLEDVESVCVSPNVPAAQALDLLSSLVGKSLVGRDDAKGVACYRLHETMREFAAIKLRESGEQEAVELRFAQYYLARCRQPALGGNGLIEWLDWAELEIDNLRAVLQRFATRADADAGIALACSLGWYWITHACTEGIRWLEEFLACGQGDRQARAWALFMRGFLAVLKADQEGARPALRAAAAAALDAGRRDLLTQALCMASIAENMAGDRASARLLLDEAHDVTLGSADVPGRLAILQARSFSGFFNADLGEVRSAASEGVRLAREADDLYRLEVMLMNLGLAGMLAGDLEESKPLLAESLRIAQQLDDRVVQFHSIAAFGCQAVRCGQPRLAAQLLGAAEKIRADAGTNVMPFFASDLADMSEAAAKALGAADFDAEFEAGRRLDRSTAGRLALGEPAPRKAALSGGPSSPILGKRQADVARLLADGLTNKQIGTRLFISERTVDSHVRSILTKLGFGSRAQIAAWVAAQEPE